MKKFYTLAIDSHHPSHYLVLIKTEGGKFFIEHLRTIEPHVKPLDILKPTLHRKKLQIVSALPVRDVILRRIQLKLKSRREILAALPFQLEEHLPFAPEETIAVPTFQIGKERSEIDLMATTKEKLESHLQPLIERGIDPDVVTAEPIALYRFAQYLFPEHASLLIYHAKNQTIAVMKDRALVAFKSVRDGDFKRALAYVQSKYPEMEQILNIGSSPLDTALQCLKVDNEDWIPYAIPIGMALDAAKKDDQSRQFRSGFFRSKKQKKTERLRVKAFLISCALFSTSTFAFGQLHLGAEKKEFLASLHLPTNAPLKEVASDLGLALRKKRGPLLPLKTIPPVHEVLTWLSVHPKLASDATITKLHYRLTKCPRLGNKITGFGAKVEIELKTDYPRIARDFHESLLQNPSFVDKRQEVCFSSDRGLYKISFFLKVRRL